MCVSGIDFPVKLETVLRVWYFCFSFQSEICTLHSS